MKKGVHTVEAEAPAIGAPSAPTIDGGAVRYVLTLADQERGLRARNASGGSNGSGPLMDELRRHPLAVAEYDAETLCPTKRMPHRRKYWFDTANLYRFDGTDYCQWYGRAASGYFVPFGRILEIIPVRSVA